MTISSNIFNTEKTDYAQVQLFLGEQKNGLFDTVNKQHPEIWGLYKKMKSLDWGEDEFNFSSCYVDFKTCSPDVYEMMIRTLAWQWEADSVAGRCIAPIVAPFITSSELWAAWTRIADNENVHAATYSEIVRTSFDNPHEVLGEILAVTESLQRLKGVGAVFAKAYDVAHKYALGLIPNDQETYNAIFMFTVGLLILERIQFMASFAVTFAICNTGLFQPIGKAVQKIAQDELEVHVELDKAVLRKELKTPRGKEAYRQCSGLIKQVFNEVLDSELNWIEYLFADGRQMLGLNADLLKRWTLFNARDVSVFLGIETHHDLPEKNPLKMMESWLDMSKTQPSPQEEDNGQYKVGVISRDDDNLTFEEDF